MAGYKYFTVLTDKGKELLAEAIANETALDFTEMAVGDSNGTSYEPTSDMTALKHVTYRAAIGSMKINAEDKNIMEFEFVVPASVGGFYIREAGLYSSDGTLIAISRLPEQYKADMAEGAGSSMTVRILVAISSDAQIYITVPASITYATKTYVTEEFKKHKADSNPHVQYVLNEIYSDKIDELQEDINSKAANTHNHDSTYLKKTDAGNTYATKEALNSGLAGKAASNHTHSNYAANNHNHDSVYSKTNHTHSNYASSSHSHDFSSITGSMNFADNRLKGLLPISKGGTGNATGLNYINYAGLYPSICTILGIGYKPRTIQEFWNEMKGYVEVSFLARKSDGITDLPANNYFYINITKQDGHLSWITIKSWRSNTTYLAYVADNIVSDWVMVRNYDGSIPANLISPTVLKYENSDGVWTETKLTTGEVMLEGYIKNNSGGDISLPKTVNVDNTYVRISYNGGTFSMGNTSPSYTIESNRILINMDNNNIDSLDISIVAFLA